MLRFLLAAPLFVHGLAHISGFLASWTSSDAGFTDRPWIFSSGVGMHSPLGRIFGLMWLVAVIGMVAAAAGLVLRQDWWLSLAIAAAALSLVVILPWWNSVPPGARIGAAFDLLVILVLSTPLKNALLQSA